VAVVVVRESLVVVEDQVLVLPYALAVVVVDRRDAPAATVHRLIAPRVLWGLSQPLERQVLITAIRLVTQEPPTITMESVGSHGFSNVVRITMEMDVIVNRSITVRAILVKTVPRVTNL